MKNATLRGKPDAGNPHVRFDEGEVAPENPKRGSLLYSGLALLSLAVSLAENFLPEEDDREIPAGDLAIFEITER